MTSCQRNPNLCRKYVYVCKEAKRGRKGSGREESRLDDHDTAVLFSHKYLARQLGGHFPLANRGAALKDFLSTRSVVTCCVHL